MGLSTEQVSKLLSLVTSAETDDIDCDGCFEHLAQFAEIELTSREVPDALQVVQQHLDQCHCCQDEYQALLEGLRALG